MTTQTPTILAIDFDGTIAHASYPELGDPKPNAVEVIRKLKEEGCYIIIWTCREGQHLHWIAAYCDLHGIPYDSINEQHPDIFNFYKNNTRKVLADIYLDDRNLGGIPEDWLAIYQLVKKHMSDIQGSKALDKIKE